jgi:hypothetical protein
MQAGCFDRFVIAKNSVKKQPTGTSFTLQIKFLYRLVLLMQERRLAFHWLGQQTQQKSEQKLLLPMPPCPKTSPSQR